ncbi:MAG: 1-deoxy-D-xylulose-5-phosphate reductoisomerase [Chloroflexi bacterium]|nr:1-deoxy-D-xylulose-5-phosphate reductoisomerase [Chloroflexota bacterium]
MTAGVEPRTRVVLLGSTGSIGRQALDVLRRDGRFDVVGLGAGRNAALLGDQIRAVGPSIAILADDAIQDGLGEVPVGTLIRTGVTALDELAARDDIDLLIVGSGGMVSLRPVLTALAVGTPVATANKETLVAGGHLVMPLARRLATERRDADAADPLASPLAWVRPIDSEHSAIWQCLAGERPDTIAGLILTASGGPFLEFDQEALDAVTPAQALHHPTWSMGSKITVDSATLANKGLEVIEAHWLYDVPYDMIDVVIHPQSVVHSAVRFVDGSVKAQLGTPDMRLPIQYALTYPERRPSPSPAPDLAAIGRLDFRKPDLTRFPALRIAREAGLAGPWAAAALMTADEIAVTRFLDGSLDFPGIPRLLEKAVDLVGSRSGPPPDVEALVAMDLELRARFGSGAVA